AQQYDSQALSELCELFFEDVYSYFYYRARDAADAQDLTNDVFVRLVESIRSFDPARGGFRAWLFSIAHHRLVDYRRRQAVRGHQPLEEGLANPEDGPAVQVEAQLTVERLQNALDLLTEEQRQVIVLKFIEGLSNAEVAQILGKSEGAINALQYRGLRALRQRLRTGAS
ncbi:sigma-70 family RNA polymerase sigma factor, partial [Candidatus Parcubacteria bacterium]